MGTLSNPLYHRVIEFWQIDALASHKPKTGRLLTTHVVSFLNKKMQKFYILQNIWYVLLETLQP